MIRKKHNFFWAVRVDNKEVFIKRGKMWSGDQCLWTKELCERSEENFFWAVKFDKKGAKYFVGSDS